MSLLGYDNNDKTLSGIVELYATDVYSTNIYVGPDPQVDVGQELITLQAEIDALTAEIVGISQGNYFVGASTNNPSNSLAEKKLYFSQIPASYNFTLVGSGTSATQIRADASGVYNVWYKINYQKVNATTAYEVRTWIMKNGVDVDYTTTIQTMDTASQWMTVSNQYTLTLNQNDYVEIVWYSPNANASSDILDFISATAPYPQVSSQTVIVSQVSNTSIGRSDEIAVGTTTTLSAGSQATVVDTTTVYPTYTLHTLDFGIPAGPAGPKGDTGNQGPKGDTGPQGPQGDTNATAISALTIALTAQATAISAQLTASGAVAVNATQDIAIAGLQADSISQDGRITVLEVKTTDQTFGAFTGTTFARRVQITNTGAGVGTDAVYLGSSNASTFLYGLTSSQPIISTNGTSQFSSLLVNNGLEVSQDLYIGDTLYIDRNTQAGKKMVLYDNSTGSDYDYMGLWTGVSTYNFENTSGSYYNWYFGNGLNTARSLAKELSLTTETTYTPTSTFLKSNGFSQQIQLIRDTPNNKVRIDLMGDTAGVNQYDGQIIQEKGNSLDDNRGIMTIQSGGLILNALNAGIQTSSTLATTFQATTTMNIISGTDTTLTSGDDITLTCNTGVSGILQTNCKTLDVNATNSITMDSGTNDITITAGDNMTLSAFDTMTINTTTLGDINITSNNNIVETATTGTITSTANGNYSITSNTGNVGLTSTGLTKDINLTAGRRVNVSVQDAVASINLTNSGIGDFTINSNNNLIVSSVGTQSILIDAGTSLTLTSGGETEINSTTFDLNASGAITLDTPSTLTTTSTGATTFNASAYTFNTTSSSSMALNTTASSFGITCNQPLVIQNTTIGEDITVSTGGQLKLISTLSGATDAMNITTNTTTGYDIVLNNTTQSNFSISCRDNLIISTPPTRSIEIDAGSGGLNLSTEGIMDLNGGSGINLTSTTNDINIDATDVIITSTSGIIGIYSAGGIDGSATTGDINFNAPAGNILSDAYGSNTIEGGSLIFTSSSSSTSTSNSDTNITSTTGDINLSAINGVINMTATNTYIANASQTDGLATLNGGFTSTASSNMNHNFLIQQNNYSGFSSTSQIGYTVSTTFDCGTVSNVLTNETSFTLPSKGVWLIICGHEWITASGNTVENKQLYFSSVAGLSGNTGIGNGLEYFEEINDDAGGASTRQKLTMSGVVVITSATTVYVNAKADVDTGTRPTCKLEYSYTRLG